jgi:hypothetical protein
MGYLRSKAFAIANGGTTSGVVDLGGSAPEYIAIETPAALTGTALAVHTSPTPTGTFKPLYADGDAVSIAIGTSRVIGICGAEADALMACRYVKFVSNAAEGAARAFTLHQRSGAG